MMDHPHQTIDVNFPQPPLETTNNTITMTVIPPTPVDTAVSTTSTTRRRRRESRDTGFPDQFTGGTTLPHPDALIGANAIISGDDLSTAQLHHRRRRSLLTKHRRTVSNGSSLMSSQASALASILPVVDPTIMPRTSYEDGNGSTRMRHHHSASPTQSSMRLSNEDGEQPSSPTESGKSKRRSWFGSLRKRK